MGSLQRQLLEKVRHTISHLTVDCRGHTTDQDEYASITAALHLHTKKEMPPAVREVANIALLKMSILCCVALRCGMSCREDISTTFRITA